MTLCPKKLLIHLHSRLKWQQIWPGSDSPWKVRHWNCMGSSGAIYSQGTCIHDEHSSRGRAGFKAEDGEIRRENVFIHAMEDKGHLLEFIPFEGSKPYWNTTWNQSKKHTRFPSHRSVPFANRMQASSHQYQADMLKDKKPAACLYLGRVRFKCCRNPLAYIFGKNKTKSKESSVFHFWVRFQISAALPKVLSPFLNLKSLLLDLHLVNSRGKQWLIVDPDCKSNKWGYLHAICISFVSLGAVWRRLVAAFLAGFSIVWCVMGKMYCRLMLGKDILCNLLQSWPPDWPNKCWQGEVFTMNQRQKGFFLSICIF